MFRSIGHGHQLLAQFGRPAFGRKQRPLLILSLVVFSAGIRVLPAVAQHGIDEPGQLVGRGRNGLGRSQMGFLPAQEGAQGAVGAMQRVGRQSAAPPPHGWRWLWSLS